MDILRKIMSERAEDVAAARRRVPEERLHADARRRAHHSLKERLARNGGTAIVAEMKKASPSAGLLRPDYRPAEIARDYAAAGAAGLSVLTEPRHFLGGEADLRAARAATDLPLLRKDFMCDPYQVAEAAAWGADVILLIVAALEPSVMRELYEAALALGLEILAEAHTEDELEAALDLPEAIAGVNSRDLKTLVTDLDVARRLAPMIPADRLSLAESGIRARADILTLEAAGYAGFLVGETLMRGDDPAAGLRLLRGV